VEGLARLAGARLLTAQSGRPPLLVVVTGPPGSGKTTVAGLVQAHLGLPLLAKDTIKETLGEQLGITEADASRRLGAAVFELLGVIVRELLGHGASLIVEGNFAVGSSVFDDLPAARIVQVHVTAPPDVLSARRRARSAERHPVHYDVEVEDELALRHARGDWDPLPLDGALVQIDTSAEAQVEARLAEALAATLP